MAIEIKRIGSKVDDLSINIGFVLHSESSGSGVHIPPFGNAKGVAHRQSKVCLPGEINVGQSGRSFIYGVSNLSK